MQDVPEAPSTPSPVSGRGAQSDCDLCKELATANRRLQAWCGQLKTLDSRLAGLDVRLKRARTTQYSRAHRYSLRLQLSVTEEAWQACYHHAMRSAESVVSLTQQHDREGLDHPGGALPDSPASPLASYSNRHG